MKALLLALSLLHPDDGPLGRERDCNIAADTLKRVCESIMHKGYPVCDKVEIEAIKSCMSDEVTQYDTGKCRDVIPWSRDMMLRAGSSKTLAQAVAKRSYEGACQ